MYGTEKWSTAAVTVHLFSCRLGGTLTSWFLQLYCIQQILLCIVDFCNKVMHNVYKKLHTCTQPLFTKLIKCPSKSPTVRVGLEFLLPINISDLLHFLVFFSPRHGWWVTCSWPVQSRKHLTTYFPFRVSTVVTVATIPIEASASLSITSYHTKFRRP